MAVPIGMSRSMTVVSESESERKVNSIRSPVTIPTDIIRTDKPAATVTYRKRSITPSSLAYPGTIRPRIRLCPMWLGRINSDSTRLNARAQATTTGNAPMRSPIWPWINLSGRKATMLVRTVATTGQKTCSVPLMAATREGSFRS